MTARAHVVMLLLTCGLLLFMLALVRSRRLLAKYAMMWVTVGVGLVILAAFPGLLEWSSDLVGIYYPPAAFLLAAVGFLLVLTIHFSWELSRLESRTGALASEVAILRERLDRLQRTSNGSPPVGGEDDRSGEGDKGEWDTTEPAPPPAAAWRRPL